MFTFFKLLYIQKHMPDYKYLSQITIFHLKEDKLKKLANLCVFKNCLSNC